MKIAHRIEIDAEPRKDGLSLIVWNESNGVWRSAGVLLLNRHLQELGYEKIDGGRARRASRRD